MEVSIPVPFCSDRKENYKQIEKSILTLVFATIIFHKYTCKYVQEQNTELMVLKVITER